MLKKQIIPIVRAFQSALPRGERQQIGGSPDEDRNISIHAPARGATIQLHLTQCCSVFQSTLPRGERHHAGFAAFYVGISIHAPTRGATISKRVSSPSLRISIHAPTRGATVDGGLCEECQKFQSTLPRGERRYSERQMQRIVQFQSTLPRGERRGRCGFQSKSRKFQSTLPRGERLRMAIHLPAMHYFNPRSHEGSDGGKDIIGGTPEISIHAPTRGATRHFDHGRLYHSNFNPRSHEGSDRFPGL